ncbi:MAG: hypothetical protein KAT32_04135 [Candidatus Moranbacteria bacterium]|nr:hypothetical protein [Candidatus Moranbacteria bacterium]
MRNMDIRNTPRETEQIKTEQKINNLNKNKKNNFIKKLIIFNLILFFIGIVIFSFFQEQKNTEFIKVENFEKEIEEKNKENIESETEIIGNKIVEEEKINVENKNETIALSPAEAEKIIKNKASKTIIAIKNKDFETVANLTHPENNLTFSPYANLNKKNLSFSQTEIKNILNDSTKYIWGEYNGISAGEIKMTFANYYEDFIYDQDYFNAEKISYNENLSSGKIKNNAQDFFPNSIIVEYYFSGFDPELTEAGMDWQSLRLIFIEIDGDWYLRAISHDELTI